MVAKVFWSVVLVSSPSSLSLLGSLEVPCFSIVSSKMTANPLDFLKLHKLSYTAVYLDYAPPLQFPQRSERWARHMTNQVRGKTRLSLALVQETPWALYLEVCYLDWGHPYFISMLIQLIGISGGIATNLFNWRANFWFLAILYFICTIVAVFTVPKDEQETEKFCWDVMKEFDIVGTICIISGIALFSSSLR